MYSLEKQGQKSSKDKRNKFSNNQSILINTQITLFDFTLALILKFKLTFNVTTKDLTC